MPTERLFDDIAASYDRMNRLLSLGLDRGWRRAAVRTLAPYAPGHILDVATGSGDLALAALALEPESITAVDTSASMLAVAAAKIAAAKNGQRIVLRRAAAEALPFADSSFDAVMAGFGVRNFADLDKGLAEMRRVLKPGGALVILEFSLPRRFPARPLHRFYLKRVIPLAGGLLTGNRAAYVRLSESISAFPDDSEFVAILERCGFGGVSCCRLFFGTCSVYTAVKPPS